MKKFLLKNGSITQNTEYSLRVRESNNDYFSSYSKYPYGYDDDLFFKTGYGKNEVESIEDLNLKINQELKKGLLSGRSSSVIDILKQIE